MKINKFLNILSLILLHLVGVLALYGGYQLLDDPSGKQLGLPEELLEPTPFDSYLIPAYILFVFIGLACFITALTGLMKIKFFPVTLIIQGIILITWLSVEIIMNDKFYFPLFHIPLYAITIVWIVTGIRLRLQAV